MLTLEEAIRHYEESEKTNKELAGICVSAMSKNHNLENAEKCRQMIDWLRELQERRKQSEIVKLTDESAQIVPNEDLISRKSAIDALQKEIDKAIPPFDDVIGSIRCGVRLSRNIIEDLPSAQPERKTATWLIHGWGDDAKCSNCGRFFKDAYDMDNYDQYCRHCGARMKGIRAI